MNCQEFKEQIANSPLAWKNELDKLYKYVVLNDAILPQYETYFEKASNYTEFFNQLYLDDEQRFTHAWAAWARLSSKSWVQRFEPFLKIEKLKLKAGGLPVLFESGVVLAPSGSYDNIVDFLVFKQGAFNAEAAEFVTSIGGTFTCSEYDFVGIYGLYQYRGNVIFEEWQAEKEPERSIVSR